MMQRGVSDVIHTPPPTMLQLDVLTNIICSDLDMMTMINPKISNSFEKFNHENIEFIPINNDIEQCTSMSESENTGKQSSNPSVPDKNEN
jgi:hypothetical protein